MRHSIYVSETLTPALFVENPRNTHVLRAAKDEKKSKKKYLKACELQQINFTPLVTSVDELLAPKFQQFLKTLAGRFSEK